MVTPDQLKRGRESLQLKPSTLKMGDQSGIKNKLNQVASLMTTPSYAMHGGTTIIAMGGDNSSTVVPNSESSGLSVIPVGASRKDMALNNIETRMISSLWKFG